MIEAVEAVRDRALRATSALAKAGIPYAVAGGNAVAAWVARVDRAAVRNTQDVDILIRRSDFDAVKTTLEGAGFVYRHIYGVDCFLDSSDSHPRDAVHILYAGEKVKPGDLVKTADVTERIKAEDYDIVTLEALVGMKLTSFRDKDRTHLRDMIEVGLIDQTWTTQVPSVLGGRLQQLLDAPEG